MGTYFVESGDDFPVSPGDWVQIVQVKPLENGTDSHPAIVLRHGREPDVEKQENNEISNGYTEGETPAPPTAELPDLLRQTVHDARNILAVLDFDLKRLVESIEGEPLVRVLRSLKCAGDLQRLCSEVQFQDRKKIQQENSAPISLVEELGPFFDSYSERARAKGIEFVVKIGDLVPKRLKFDTMKYRQILANLLENSLRHTHVGGIRIYLSYFDSFLTSMIRDSGEGIDESHVRTLFTPHSNAIRIPGNERSGTSCGLGLYNAREIARIMGGDLTLIKTSPGWGSVFQASIRVGCEDQDGI